MLEKEKLYDLAKILRYWMKEAEHPHYLGKSDEFKRKVGSVSYEEKYHLESVNKAMLEKRVNWMIEN